MFRSVKPSRAIVHRTIAFRFSNLGRNDKKDRTQKGSVFFVISGHFRCHFFRLIFSLEKQENSNISFASFDNAFYILHYGRFIGLLLATIAFLARN